MAGSWVMKEDWKGYYGGMCMTALHFYEDIEEGVRPYVMLLRNAGINTECSCHHEGYIQCQSVGPSEEIDRIRRSFIDKVDYYTIEVTYTNRGDDWFQSIEIRSPMFIKERETNMCEGFSSGERECGPSLTSKTT